ncbi:MAG TPA: MOSC domain-containing protein [Blastocatellia bacterium]|nr:MOSC domain-containing protein [Blastocatellia bacterium]
MKLISVNNGLPREVSWEGKLVQTSIFKEPVDSPLMLRTLNLDGDRQADLSLHGGVAKAAYAYPSEHYEYWRGELPETDFPWGMFGENFTTEGMFEDVVRIGDRYRIGEAEVVVTQPRMPCYKLGIKFGRADMVKRFLASRRSGFYFAILREGMVAKGDDIKLVFRNEQGVTVADITRLFAFDKDDLTTMERAIRTEALPEKWKEYFQQRIDKQRG